MLLTLTLALSRDKDQFTYQISGAREGTFLSYFTEHHLSFNSAEEMRW
jgi:hypothetical protein